MKRTFTALCLASTLALTVGVGAQQPGTSVPARTDGVSAVADYEQAASKTGSPDTTMTLTGCLDRTANGTYELRNARMSSLGSPAASTGATGASTTGTRTGATGTSGVTSVAKAPITDRPLTWTLKSTTDLAPHVGHQVQITGRASAVAGTGGSDTATTSAPTTTATGARMKSAGEDAHSVDVQSVRMISQSCS